MDKTQLAVQNFNHGDFSRAEKLALEIFEADNKSVDAVDILSAIHLKTNHLDFIDNLSKKHLLLIREIATFLTNLYAYDHAAFFYEKAVELVPDDIVGLNNLALMYENLEEPQKALSAYQKSIQIKENYPAIYNLGVLYRKLKNINLAKKYLRKALYIQPNNPYANYSLGMTYLMEKDFKNGYPYFMRRPVENAGFLKNFWNGEPHKDKTLLVFCEYGLGDAIMFSRYFPFLKNFFAKIKVCTKTSLISLFEKSFEDIEFVTSPDTEYDYSSFVMDLPFKLNMDFEKIPNSEGYLRANENLVREYKEKYFNTNNKKIGIFFVGGELQKRNAKYRSIPLKYLSKLFSKKDTCFYSFQKEDVFDELKDFPEIINLGKDFRDFSDTAAAMKNLDLLITIDSAPVHLAGALGLKTFLMLPFYSEWRWFTDEKITPWYKSVELFRQTTPCDWQSVVDEIYKRI